jgi:hypothetical protein
VRKHASEELGVGARSVTVKHLALKSSVLVAGIPKSSALTTARERVRAKCLRVARM